jgi:hypothetical protein
VTYADLQKAAQARHLTILGGFHPTQQDRAPDDCKTLVLLGPNEPDFWPAFTRTPEWQDGALDPMDRWSARVIGDWAQELNARALFPFGGAPYLPFFSWATRTGRIHASPVLLLVHDTAGLFVSFRGALAFSDRIDLPEPPDNPCLTCETIACRTACPVDALDGIAYDVPRCKSFLDTKAGQDCMTQGCAARRACPVSQTYARLPVQSAYHMATFKG